MSFMSKIPGVRIVIRIYEYIHRPAPLQEYGDYDEYWHVRSSGHSANRELDRFKIIANLIEDGSSVLDVGCGDGAFQKYLSQINPNSTSLGVDSSLKAISLAKDQGCSAQLIDPDFRLKDQVPGAWDVVTQMETLEHVADAEDLMQQVLELQPKRIFITIPNVGCLKHRLRLMFGGRFPITTIIFHMKEHLRFWTPKDFRQWVETFGLQVKSSYGQFEHGDWVVEWAVRKYPEIFASQIIYELQVKVGK